MDYKVIDILRSPTVIVLDALISQRLKLPWKERHLFCLLITSLGSFLSLILFACQKEWLLLIYRFLSGVAILSLSTFLQTYLVASCYKTYNLDLDSTNKSTVLTIIQTTIDSTTLPQHEVDFILKLFMFLIVQLCLYKLFSSEYLFGSKSSLHYFVTCSSTVASLFNVSENVFGIFVFLTLLPQFYSLYTFLGKGYSYLNSNFRQIATRTIRNVRANGIPFYIDDLWSTLRVPQVLRIFFVFRCTWATFVIATSSLTVNESVDASKPLGILQYIGFIRTVTPVNVSDDIQSISPNPLLDIQYSTNSYNFSFVERFVIELTDSMLSSFSISSAMSIPLYYCGVEINKFIGGNDLIQAEALGTVSAILFCLLAIQTGLSGLSPLRRLVRVYRNMCLLFAAILHYVHDLVHPVLMTLSAQANIPVKNHIKPLLITVVLACIPFYLCVWLLQTSNISTWLIALTAFSIELIVKVLTTLILYIIFALDARVEHQPWPHLDDWVFYVRSTSYIIEFFCGCVMFVNGAYVLFFEAGSALRAVMMSMHAYVNIYKAARDGWKTWNNRRTVNLRISGLRAPTDEYLIEHADDVCSICYQNFTADYGEVRNTNCNHLFHSMCLRKWLYIQETCPMCHQNIFSQEPKLEKEN